VGRDEERSLLLDRQRLAWGGSGQVVLVSGEAGIGKSRLAAWLAEQLPSNTFVRMIFQCSPYHKDNALHPFIAQLRREGGFEFSDSAEIKLAKIEALAAHGDPSSELTVQLLGSLLSLEIPHHDRQLILSPTQQRRETLRVLMDRIVALSKKKPLLLMFEDWHWADATSIELLDRLVEKIPRMRALALVTHRPEFSPAWRLHSEISVIHLNRLDRRHTQMIVQQMASGRELPEPILAQVVSRTDGIPLFVEELVKTVLESGLLADSAEKSRTPLPPLAIPATLQDSLMERLDRLATVRGVAQIGAAIGREFSFALICAVADTDPVELTQALARLEEAELVFRRGAPPNASYAFKHALVQDTAYGSLLKSRRQILHRKIGETLCEKFGEQAETEPEVIAHHFMEAGLVEAAIGWWDKAGRRAVSRLANVEAAQNFAKGLELIGGMPPTSDRDRLELSFRVALGLPLLATRGYASAEVETNYELASNLSIRVGDVESEFAGQRGLWNCIYDRGDLTRSLTLSEHLLKLAGDKEDAAKAGLAWRAIGSARMSRAEFLQSEEAFDRCIDECMAISPQLCIERYGEAPQVIARQYKGLVQCVRGQCDQGLNNARSALETANKLNHPLSQAFASDIVAMVLLLRRDYRACEELTRTQIEFSNEHGFIFWHAAHQIAHGASSANLFLRQIDALEAKIGIENWRKTDALLHVPTWSSFLADAAIAAKDLSLAETAILEGIAIAMENNDHFVLADLERLNGLLLSSQGRQKEAYAALRQAVQTAREQGACLYHLRAARDLARLMADDDPKGAAAMLKAAMENFLEHREGLDFQESVAVLRRIEGL
jgi:predicted ATPase